MHIMFKQKRYEISFYLIFVPTEFMVNHNLMEFYFLFLYAHSHTESGFRCLPIWTYSSSSSSTWRVWTLWHRSVPWHGHRSVHDRPCSKQTQLLLQTDFPLQVQIKSWRKSEDINPSNKIGSSPDCPSCQPWVAGSPIAGFATCAFTHILVWNEALKTCCLNVDSQGGAELMSNPFLWTWWRAVYSSLCEPL